MKNIKYNALRNFSIKLFFIMLAFSSVCVNAQTTFDDDVADAAPAPIDNYVWYMAAIGLIYVFYKVRAMSLQRK